MALKKAGKLRDFFSYFVATLVDYMATELCLRKKRHPPMT